MEQKVERRINIEVLFVVGKATYLPDRIHHDLKWQKYSQFCNKMISRVYAFWIVSLFQIVKSYLP